MKIWSIHPPLPGMFELTKQKQLQQIYITHQSSRLQLFTSFSSIFIHSPDNMTSTLFSLFTHLHLWISLPLNTLPPLASLKCPCSAGWRWFKCLIRFIVRKFLWWSLHDFLWWSLSSLQVRSFHAKDMFLCGCEYAWQFICTTGHMYMH